MRFTTPLSLVVSFFLTAAVHAAGPTPLDVFVPPITSPTAETVWVSKTQQTLTWDASGAPPNISNGALLLLRSNGITAPFILAQDFDLRTGNLTITVPWGSDRNDLSACLNNALIVPVFGDSGNFSPEFTIQTSD
ncbi:hypothetical protein B0H14DRAFT_2602892 [Mycena olivaceomarginata]|nr:hypothetical protein B0H14DRAFT_2602892 [Mycena olivaceomarginata]